VTCKTSKTPGPPLTFELPRPEVIESNDNWAWALWDGACADMDEVSDWAVSHPFINPRAEFPPVKSSTGVCRTDVGRGLSSA